MNLLPISLTTSHQPERTGKENRVQVFLAHVLPRTHIHHVTSWLLRSGIIIWIATAYDWKKSFTHIGHRALAVGRGELGELNPSPHPLNIYFRLSGFQSSLLFIHFRYGPTAPKSETESIRHVTLHFWVQGGAVSLRHRNGAKIIVLMCEQKSYPVWFSCGRKSNPVLCEHSLRSSNRLISPFDGLRRSFCFVLHCVFLFFYSLKKFFHR